LFPAGRSFSPSLFRLRVSFDTCFVLKRTVTILLNILENKSLFTSLHARVFFLNKQFLTRSPEPSPPFHTLLLFPPLEFVVTYGQPPMIYLNSDSSFLPLSPSPICPHRSCSRWVGGPLLPRIFFLVFSRCTYCLLLSWRIG